MESFVLKHDPFQKFDFCGVDISKDMSDHVSIQTEFINKVIDIENEQFIKSIKEWAEERAKKKNEFLYLTLVDDKTLEQILLLGKKAFDRKYKIHKPKKEISYIKYDEGENI